MSAAPDIAVQAIILGNLLVWGIGHATVRAIDPPRRKPRLPRAIALVAALALVGCAVDERPEPQLYTCTIVYRCAGAEQLSAALALPCAYDLEDALERATAAGIEAAHVRCVPPWQYVRPLCSLYQPAESCEVTEP